MISDNKPVEEMTESEILIEQAIDQSNLVRIEALARGQQEIFNRWRIHNIIYAVIGGLLAIAVAVVSIAVIIQYLDEKDDDRVFDKLEEVVEQNEEDADARRINACVAARESAIADNAQDTASIADIQADIDLLTPTLGNSSNPDTIARLQAFLERKQQVIEDILANQQPIRICTTEAIEAFGEGRPEAYEPTTQPPVESEPVVVDGG